MEYVVNCTRKDIKNLPDNLPRNIHRLDLSFNSLGNSSFKNLELYGNDLMSLSIASNNVTIINTDILSSLTHLEELDLTGNLLDYIDDRLFLALNLRKLSGISAKMFHHSAFWKLVSLEDLSVIFEQELISVKSIPRDIFKGQLSLKFATLQNIEDIPPLDLPVQLDNLDMSGSNVFRVSPDIFMNLNNLRELNLSNSSLSSLESESFIGLSSLSDLDLSRNKIVTLPNKLFEACRYTLDYLDLKFALSDFIAL
ncbi:leucine-rich repeats and immunoglobulin-like domains protein sma-10 [Mytilus californianus]|uniref:leucine-rich repeats and immunoglobulin-like domains protein sma-10 n=1 Tax=Mytilus californianus TaxID=6549 RepID=UPI002247C678|nr:leucine-rich repeats and immunoglobulin-like domains protein sma-10 [Mytilus californianus]